MGGALPLEPAALSWKRIASSGAPAGFTRCRAASLPGVSRLARGVLLHGLNFLRHSHRRNGLPEGAVAETG